MMTETARRYGGSLYELASEEGRTDEVLAQLTEVLALMKENPRYEKLLSEPSIPKGERVSLLDQAFGSSLWPYLLNFLKILCENGTMGSLKGCAQEYRRRFNEDNGIVEVCAVTAVELKPALKDALQAKLQSVLGKTVELSCRVDPACMGGVLLELPGRQLDGTVKHRLDALSASLKAAAL